MMTPQAWLSYTIRPYDVVTDRRRWFWRRPSTSWPYPCTVSPCSICGRP